VREFLRAMLVPAVVLTVSHFFLMPYLDALGAADTTAEAPPEDGSGA